MTIALAPTRTGESLSSRLRQRTRAAHAASERVFVRAVKARPSLGPSLLMSLNASLAAWLDGVARRVGAGPLAVEIEAFLRALREAHGGLRAPALPGPVLAEEAGAVGAAYAVCGSALGAASLAEAWREETAPDWRAFCAASRALERRWPAFAVALDRWGERPPRGVPSDPEDAVVAGAEAAFAYAAALTPRLAGESRP